MFKSVFSKYVATFTCIILISFIIISVSIVSNATINSAKMKSDIVGNTNYVITQGIAEGFSASKTNDFKSFIGLADYKLNLSKSLSMMVKTSGDDLFVMIVSLDGDILKTGGEAGEKYSELLMSQDALDKLSKLEEGKAGRTKLGGFFEKEHIVSAGRVFSEDEKQVGYVLVCTEEMSFKAIENKTIKVAVVTCLWVLFVALIAVYFICNKIIGPLKQMRSAAKDFSQGKFDVRVPVEGRDEVAELATAFNNMATELAKNEDMRRTFLANVSHDLRTPMTTISGFIEGILSGAIPPEKQNYYLDIISTEVKRLSRLVSSLLDISRFQAGERKIVKSVFDICEMARQILISFENKIGEKRLDVSFECDEDNMYAYADKDAIYQVLYNLCDNGVKFSRDGGKYKIRIISENKKIYVSVYNEGEGIPSDELPYVFDRFYKSDKSRGLDKTGVGLGLYIVKTIIDSHNEEICVKSAYGEYCEFIFTLDRSYEAQNKK